MKHRKDPVFMKADNIILTICVPSYNRVNFLVKQLSFFQKQIANNPDIMKMVRFIISDNASSDSTSLMLNSWKKESRFFDYYTNKKNLGLVGNIITLLNRSTSDYVWFVSDDDQLQDGVIEKVLDVLYNYKPEFVFLNFSNSNNPEKLGYSGPGGLHVDSKGTALNIFKESYGALVFMTACIHKRQNLLELKNDKMFTRISAPMLFSFYSSSKGPIYIVSEQMIVFNEGNESYAGLRKILKIKFEEYIEILERLSDFGYDKEIVVQSIKIFFLKQSHAHFLYNFINFSRSIKYYKYYTAKTFLYFPVNIYKYLTF